MTDHERDDLGDLPEIPDLFPCIGEAGERTVNDFAEVVRNMTAWVEQLQREGPMARPAPSMLPLMRDVGNTWLERQGIPKRIE